MSNLGGVIEESSPPDCVGWSPQAMGKGELILFSLSDNKIYVGFVLSNYNPASTAQSLTIMPILGGYRDKDTQLISFTTLFRNGIIENDSTTYNAAPFRDYIADSSSKEIVIPFGEIKLATRFDDQGFAKTVGDQTSRFRACASHYRNQHSNSKGTLSRGRGRLGFGEAGNGGDAEDGARRFVG